MLTILLFYALLLIKKDLNRWVFKKIEKNNKWKSWQADAV